MKNLQNKLFSVLRRQALLTVISLKLRLKRFYPLSTLSTIFVLKKQLSTPYGDINLSDEKPVPSSLILYLKKEFFTETSSSKKFS